MKIISLRFCVLMLFVANLLAQGAPKTNSLQLLAATAGVGQYAKCVIQHGRSTTNILVHGLPKEIVPAWNAVVAADADVERLEGYVVKESSRIRRIQDSGAQIEWNSPLSRQMDALDRKERDLAAQKKAAAKARSDFRKLARVNAVFTNQIYGGMQVWRVVE